jgi:hypothetical protein
VIEVTCPVVNDVSSVAVPALLHNTFKQWATFRSSADVS